VCDNLRQQLIAEKSASVNVWECNKWL
jgi:hypothetical protein